MAIRFTPLTERHIPAAISLAQEAFTRECRHVPELASSGVPELHTGAITDLVRHGCGVAATERDELAGYMSFYGPIQRFFGDGTGGVSPLHGNAAAGCNRARLYSLLFQHAADRLVTNGVNTFAITAYSHDQDAATALSLNGFGVRCADAIRAIDPPLDASPVPGITCGETSWAEAIDLLPLKNGLVRHLSQSPIFVAAGEFTREQFAELNSKRRSRFFVARDGSSPVGYLEVTDDGENVLTTAPDMVNICGAFLDAAYRGQGIYRILLQYTLATLRREGVRRIGVDFETMNPTALHFWSKDFTCYTYSYARRIDKLR